MKLTYQTATATFIQFVAMVILGVPTALVSIISTCHSDSTNCVSNMITSIIFLLITAFWFGIILVVGYLAQKNRSNRWAIVLICCELPTLVAAGLINFPHENDILGKATSLLDFFLGLVIIYLAFRVLFARGGRIVTKPRQRKNSP